MNSETDRPGTSLPRHDGLAAKTLGSLIWMLSGHMSRVLVRVAATVVLARILTPQDFGLAAAAFTVVHFAELFGLLGLGPALVQRRELDDEHIRTAFTFSITFGIAVGALLWLLAPTFGSVFRSSDVGDVLRIAVLVFPLHGLAVVGESLLQRSLRFRALMAVEAIALAVGYGLIGIGMASAGWGVWSLVAAAIAQAAIRSAGILVVQRHSVLPTFSARAFRDLASIGGGVTLSRVSNYLALQGDTFIVGRWLGIEALGFYSRAFGLVGTLSNLLGQAIEKVLFSSMSRVQDKPARLRIAYDRGVALTGLLLVPCSALTWVLAPEIITVFLGPGWLEVVAPFRIFAIGMVLRISTKVGVSLATATGAVYRNAWRQIAYATLVGIGASIGLRWGLAGVAWGVLIALAIHAASITQLSLRLLGGSVRQSLSLYLPAAWLGPLVALEAWSLANWLRDVSDSELLTLVATPAIIVITVLVLARTLPSSVFGAHAEWLVGLLRARLLARFTQGRRQRAIDSLARAKGPGRRFRS